MNKYYVTLRNGGIKEVNCDRVYIGQGAIEFWARTNEGLLDYLVVAYATGEWKTVVQEEHNES